MFKLLGITAVVALTASAAHASIITFSGASSEEADAEISFDGRVNDTAGTGSVSVKYFFDNPTSPGPIFGSETITGPASLFQAGVEFPPDGVALDLTITDGSSFELRETTFGGLTVAFADPSRGIDAVDRASLTSFVVANVPLPSSAPLFGAALLALGAAGYGSKRKALRAAALAV